MTSRAIHQFFRFQKVFARRKRLGTSAVKDQFICICAFLYQIGNFTNPWRTMVFFNQQLFYLIHNLLICTHSTQYPSHCISKLQQAVHENSRLRVENFIKRSSLSVHKAKPICMLSTEFRRWGVRVQVRGCFWRGPDIMPRAQNRFPIGIQ